MGMGPRYERWVRATEVPLLGLAVLFLGVLLLPLVAPLTAGEQGVVDAVGVGIWVAFAVDYAVRLHLAEQRWRFVRTHVIDLVIILLPVLRPLRVARLLTLVRGIGVLGYLHRGLGRTLHARVGAYVGLATVVVVLSMSVVMYDAEKGAPEANIRTIGDALWWAVTTVTTVGYGDRYPTTTSGRLVAVSLMLVGIALLGVVTASVASWFVSRLDDSRASERRTELAVADLVLEVQQLRAAVARLTDGGSTGPAGAGRGDDVGRVGLEPTTQGL